MTMIASHRGGSHLWPENSRIAFRQTAELPVEMAEFDVHQTSDGVLVVHHDSTIDRMTDGAGALSALSYGELQRRVILGSGGETIPTLNEVIAIFKPSAVDLRLEIKTAADGKPYDGMEIRILDELRASDMLGRTLITSFALERLTAFRAALAAEDMTDGDTRGLMWLCAPSVVASIGWTGVEAALHAYGIEEIGLRADAVSGEIVTRLTGAGVIVHGWAAHTAHAAERMFECGLVSFTTDRPDIAIAVRAKLEKT